MAALRANMTALNDEPKTTERCAHHIHMVTNYNRLHRRPQACPTFRLKKAKRQHTFGLF